jgi:hypothetical protein
MSSRTRIESVTLVRQPDDPGIDSPANPYAPVRFEDSFAGRQTAWLGSVLIGEVAPNHGGKFQKASALIHLPHVPRKVWPASSLKAARHIVVRETLDWIARTQLKIVEAVR